MVLSRRHFGKLMLAGGCAGLVWPNRAQAAPEWVDQRQVGPFICQSAFPLVRYESLLSELPGLQQELQRVLAVQPSTKPIYVHLLADEQQYEAYIAERFPDVPYRRALFIKQDGQASVFAYHNRELAVDLRHECTHAMLHGDLPMVPLSLDEGIAEYYEVEKRKRARHHPHLRALQRDLLFGRALSLGELESKQRLEDLSARDYRSAWAWVHFMLHGPVEAFTELVLFLNDIRTNTAPGSLAERLAAAIPHVGDRMKRHFQNL